MTTKTITLPFDVSLPSIKNLRAGQLTCFYEEGRVRSICCHGFEIVQMLYAAVRDENWQTIEPVLSNEQLNISDNVFTINYTASYKKDAIHFEAQFSIEGNSSGELVCSFEGVALSSFRKNRIGLCIHHPIRACAGKKVEITEANGQTIVSTFPQMISPHQPFRDIAGMRVSFGEELQADFLFEGDIFETEDQRNWSDSSYKTYSTPLELPFPVWLRKEDRIKQRITIRMSGRPAQKSIVVDSVREEKIRFPKIGYGLPMHALPLTNSQVDRILKIPLDHCRVELYLTKTGWKDVWSTAGMEATRLGASLELVIITDDLFDMRAAELFAAIDSYKHLITHIMILHNRLDTFPRDEFGNACRLFKQRFPHINIGYGTNGHFAELNRNRPHDSACDFVGFCLSPQVHATDTRSVLENIANQRDLLTTAQEFSSQPVHVYVTLKERLPLNGNERSVRSAAADPRQYSSLIAYWTLQAIQQLVRAERISFYELTGDAGLLTEENVSSLYEVLVMIKLFNPAWIILQPNITDSVVIENARGERLDFKLQTATSL